MREGRPLPVVHRRITADLLRSAASHLRKIPGSLVLIPLAVLATGGQYRCATSETIDTGLVSRLAADGSPSLSAVPVPLRFQPDRVDAAEENRLRDGESVVVELPVPVNTFTLEVQADCCNTYDVSGITAEGESTRLWLIPAVYGREGQRRRSAEINTEAAVTALRVAPTRGNGDYAVSAIRITVDRTFEPAVLVYFAWGLFLLLIGVIRVAPRVRGQMLLDAWGRADALITMIVVPTLVFRVTPTVLAITAGVAVAALAVVACRAAFRRLAYPALIYNGAIIALAVWSVPLILTAVVRQSIDDEYNSMIDHRLRPDGDEINADSVRFRGTSESIDAEDFNIVFLGDSFTFGLHLEYTNAVPYAIERELASRHCQPHVRAINFGWTSSSPFLSLRLVHDIAHKYHPDLVVYMLDMTDFHDDLRYEEELRFRREVEVLPSEIVYELVERTALMAFEADALREIVGSLRYDAAADEAAADEPTSLPEQRFFITNQPLEYSVADIERGVVKNLQRIHDYATGELGAPISLWRKSGNRPGPGAIESRTLNGHGDR